MNWYIAKIIFQIVCGNGQHTPQFDEQLRLVSAGDAEEAYTKACQLGRKEEDTFYNEKKQLVQWRFINVSELFRLSDFIDGAELHSRIEEKEDAREYIQVVNRKAAQFDFSATDQMLTPA
ncbi:MAG TPA: DUF4288 domain-containing protein [Chitinophagaceae bacterium]|nr:DUF4288 domain-containing protein [Chitinophagaceae bacterium]